jgi:hypothetical protein
METILLDHLDSDSEFLSRPNFVVCYSDVLYVAVLCKYIPTQRKEASLNSHPRSQAELCILNDDS